jgi:hypothetical protein
MCNPSVSGREEWVAEVNDPQEMQAHTLSSLPLMRCEAQKDGLGRPRET